jgi:hypothetical protein
VPCDPEAGATLHGRRRGLDEAAGDRGHGPAAFTPHVLVVLARWLEAGLPVSKVDAKYGSLVLEPPQGTEDRREVSGQTAIGQGRSQLLDRPVVAGLLGKQLRQGRADVAGPRDGGTITQATCGIAPERNNAAAMCVQCMMTAMGSVAAASGTRTWLGRKKAEWLTPRRLRFITVALFVGAVLAAGTMSGSGGA